MGLSFQGHWTGSLEVESAEISRLEILSFTIKSGG
jgi:hypothetical protein